MPSNLMSVFWPETAQSGPTASTMTSLAKPLPIGLGCYNIP